jgi:hypothetical protein
VKVRPATVNVPVRCDELVLFATVNPTLPFPVPSAAVVIVIHEVLLVDDHAQPAVVVIDVEPAAPAAGADRLAGEIAYEHVPAAWLTVNVCPPIVSVPCRVCVCALPAAEYPIVPLPLPLDPEMTVSHDGALLLAVQAHPAGALTAVDPVAPFAAIEVLTGVSVNVQPSAAWLTVKVWPAIVSVPCRVCVTPFAAAANVTVPLPLPLAPVLTLSQAGVLVAAVQAQPVGAVTLAEPLPPLAPTDVVNGDTV